MIRVHKSSAPKALTKKADDERRKLEESYDKDPAAHQSGRKTLKIKKGTYGHPDVRRALSKSQHRKCCFCEAVVNRPQALEHVEHYRPKGRVRQWSGEEPFLPGYYWLAYEWTNLFMACHYCNSTQKVDQFPVVDPGDRPRDHHQTGRSNREVPLVLDPGADTDFSLHIRFVGDRPVGLSPEGLATIRVVGLADPAHEGRLQHLADLKDLMYEIEVLAQVIASGVNDPRMVATHLRLVDKFDQLRRSEAPYSAMVRDHLAGFTGSGARLGSSP